MKSTTCQNYVAQQAIKKTMFLGRTKELELLNSRKELKTASLIVCKGRRRVGKSTLIREFGASFEDFIEFQGIAPNKTKEGNTRQLSAFSEQFAQQFAMPSKFEFTNWTEAFSLLAERCEQKKSVLVFLDEISWMAEDDSDFSGKLKIAWDTHFKNNPNLILVLCGSVSSWIDRHILNSTGFVGRVSLTIALKELELEYCNLFWGKHKERVSSLEKAKTLSVTGGVPRYLEEIDPKLSAEENIGRLCFSTGGMLFSEFDNVFNEQFGERVGTYRAILNSLVRRRLGATEIAKKLEKSSSGYLSSCLSDLEEAGFIRLDPGFTLAGGKSRSRRYRISDNYTRFYLYYVAPQAEKIRQGLFRAGNLENLSEWATLIGLQFENLILNNIPSVVSALSIPFESVISAGPYYQNKTKRQDACQIDLVIASKHSIYLAEIKCRKQVNTEVITEMKEKIAKLKLPKGKTVRPVLIYQGELSEAVLREDYFSKVISFSELLKTKEVNAT